MNPCPCWRHESHRPARGRLTYDLQAFVLDPSGVPMYFVRAEWRVDGKIGFGASLWLRGRQAFEIVAQDLRPARWVRMFEFGGQLGRPRYGQVLNVLDRDGDGWGEIVFSIEGYEGMGVELRELTPAGWSEPIASYGFGC
jgi:hypothetical protein